MRKVKCKKSKRVDRVPLTGYACGEGGAMMVTSTGASVPGVVSTSKRASVPVSITTWALVPEASPTGTSVPQV